MAEVWGLLSQLRPHLDPREEVLAVVQGAFEAPESGAPTPRPGILVATQQRVAFFPEGAGDGDLLPFAYGDMSDLAREMSILGHELTFRVDGRTARLSRISDGLSMEQFATAVSERMGRDGAARPSNSGEILRPPTRDPGPPPPQERTEPPAPPAPAAPAPPTGRPPAVPGPGSNDPARWAPAPDASPQPHGESRGPRPPNQNSGPVPSGPIPRQDRFFTPPGHVDRSPRTDTPTARPPSPSAAPPHTRPDRTPGLRDGDDSSWSPPTAPPHHPPAEPAPARPRGEPATPPAPTAPPPSSLASGPIPTRDTGSHRPPATSGPIPKLDTDPDRTASGPIPTSAPAERSATSSPPAPPPSPPTPPKPPVEQPEEPTRAPHREDDSERSVATPERSGPTPTSGSANSEPARPVPTPAIADRTPLFDSHPRAPSLRASQQGGPKSSAPGREPADEDTRRLTIFRALDVIRDLHRLGVLSTDEWAAQRADLLNRL